MINTTNTAANALIIYTVEDIMAILHICKTTAYILMNSDGFPSFRVGRSLRVEKTAFEKWLKTYEGKQFIM